MYWNFFRVHECGFDHCCELKDCVSKVIFEFSQVLGINSQVFSLLDSSSWMLAMVFEVLGFELGNLCLRCFVEFEVLNYCFKIDWIVFCIWVWVIRIIACWIGSMEIVLEVLKLQKWSFDVQKRFCSTLFVQCRGPVLPSEWACRGPPLFKPLCIKLWVKSRGPVLPSKWACRGPCPCTCTNFRFWHVLMLFWLGVGSRALVLGL